MVIESIRLRATFESIERLRNIIRQIWLILNVLDESEKNYALWQRAPALSASSTCPTMRLLWSVITDTQIRTSLTH